MERKVFGITLKDRKQATWIREETKVEDVVLMIIKNKWSWTDHIMCGMDNRWTKKVTEWHLRNQGFYYLCKKLQEKPRKAENQVETRSSGIRWCRMEYANIRERWKGLGKAFVLQWTSYG